MEAFNSGFLDGTVHAFHLPICPGMVDLGEPIFNVVFSTCAGKDMFKGERVFFPIGELNTIIGKNGMDFIGNSLNKLVQEREPMLPIRQGRILMSGQCPRTYRACLGWFAIVRCLYENSLLDMS